MFCCIKPTTEIKLKKLRIKPEDEITIAKG